MTLYTTGAEYKTRATAESTGLWEHMGLALSQVMSNLDPTSNYTFEVQWCQTQNECSDSATAFKAAAEPSKLDPLIFLG